jgi:hypothetical protein
MDPVLRHVLVGNASFIPKSKFPPNTVFTASNPRLTKILTQILRSTDKSNPSHPVSSLWLTKILTRILRSPDKSNPSHPTEKGIFYTYIFACPRLTKILTRIMRSPGKSNPSHPALNRRLTKILTQILGSPHKSNPSHPAYLGGYFLYLYICMSHADVEWGACT